MANGHRKEQRNIEDMAAAAAAHIIGARAERVDTGSAGQVRDFDLVFPDSHREPLEVSQHVHEITRRSQARLARDTGFKLDLAQWWIVHVPYLHVGPKGEERELDVRQIVRELEPLLQELERRGISEFDLTKLYLDGELQQYATVIDELDITGGHAHAATLASGETLYLTPGGGGAVDPASVAEAAEREASRDDNRRKLEEPPDALRRHLFIPVDLTAGLTYLSARLAYETGDMPPVPTLADPVTTVWVAVGRMTELLSVTPPEDWERHTVPAEVRDNPDAWVRLSDRVLRADLPHEQKVQALIDGGLTRHIAATIDV